MMGDLHLFKEGLAINLEELEEAGVVRFLPLFVRTEKGSFFLSRRMWEIHFFVCFSVNVSLLVWPGAQIKAIAGLWQASRQLVTSASPDLWRETGRERMHRCTQRIGSLWTCRENPNPNTWASAYRLMQHLDLWSQSTKGRTKPPALYSDKKSHDLNPEELCIIQICVEQKMSLKADSHADFSFCVEIMGLKLNMIIQEAQSCLCSSCKPSVWLKLKTANHI